MQNSTSQNKTLEILKYWHLVEFFVPFDLDDACSHYDSDYLEIATEHLFSEAGNQLLPWISPLAFARAQGSHEKKYRYNIYLLPFDKSELTRISREVFPLENYSFKNIEFEERLDDEGRTCFAKLMLDNQGRPNFSAFSVSTLPWAIGRLKENRLDLLNTEHYAAEQKKLGIALNDLAKHIDSGKSSLIDDQTQPGVLTAKSIMALLGILQKWANFSPEYPCSLVIELKEIKKLVTPSAKSLPEQKIALETKQDTSIEPNEKIEQIETIIEQIVEEDEPVAVIEAKDEFDILNSFFITDLEKVINDLSLKTNIKIENYLHGISRDKKIDLYAVNNQSVILNQLKPEKCNAGRWPASPDQFMSLMQQLAINANFSSEKSENILSVNGPPGTGKTTMLQDIVAENIVRRARVLANFKTAEATLSSKKFIAFDRGEDYFIQLLHPDLTGFEMLVASTNNAAVENISKDLPRRGKLGKAYQADISYLTAVAAKVSATQRKGEIVPLKTTEKPWGLISVALGNSHNRSQFRERLFFSDDGAEALEKRVKKGEYLTIWEWRRQYKGKTFNQAKKEFQKQEKQFNDYSNKIIQLEQLHASCNAQAFSAWLLMQEKNLNILDEKILAEKLENQKITDSINRNKAHKADLYQDIEQNRHTRPHLFARIFRTQAAKAYAKRERALNEVWMQLLDEGHSLQLVNHEIDKILAELTSEKENLLKSIASKKIEQTQQTETYQNLLKELADIELPNLQDQDDEKIQLRAFWQNETFNHLRTELFIKALNLHEAWLAEVMRDHGFNQNLRAISSLLDNKKPLEKSAEKFIWQSLFMMVPVISSTFASIARQFNQVGANELGWLLIDEAGQAVPQAAVGAMWRFQHCLVVGDPCQIEPVFTIPANLIEGLAKYKLPYAHEKWLPTKTSIQLLADEANPLGANIEFAHGSQWIGCPLRVHRRCLNPMFSVANQIAYENKMIQARKIAKNLTDDYPLGDSAWFDVAARTTDKQYVAAQGNFLLQLLLTLLQKNPQLPEIYIITPFKRIKLHLTQLIKNLNKISSQKFTVQELSNWAKTHIGTIHTFQGKEADAVIFILGADNESEGSVNWVASKPNLLNVALTRARNRIYVIGDYDLWSNKKYFSDLARVIERVKIDAAALQISSIDCG